MSRCGIIVVGLKDDESKCKEALRGCLVLSFLILLSLRSLAWSRDKSFSTVFKIFFIVVVFYLEDERQYQCVFVSTCTLLHWLKKCCSSYLSDEKKREESR